MSARPRDCILDNAYPIEDLSNVAFYFLRREFDDISSKEFVDLAFEVHEGVPSPLLNLADAELLELVQVRICEEECIHAMGLQEERELEYAKDESELVPMHCGHWNFTKNS